MHQVLPDVRLSRRIEPETQDVPPCFKFVALVRRIVGLTSLRTVVNQTDIDRFRGRHDGRPSLEQERRRPHQKVQSLALSSHSPGSALLTNCTIAISVRRTISRICANVAFVSTTLRNLPKETEKTVRKEELAASLLG